MFFEKNDFERISCEASFIYNTTDATHQLECKKSSNSIVHFNDLSVRNKPRKFYTPKMELRTCLRRDSHINNTISKNMFNDLQIIDERAYEDSKQD